MENFLVSARKYRPATFGHVVGQPHVTTTLKHAIKDKQLAHAFLFCGPEGIGKTTCARILAKAINCQQITEDTEPCNACVSCRSSNQGGSLNIYEIDAASNNSVEAIRSLVEQVRYPPQASQYKAYIIDEVHMLSSAAFNAFLKTLEEPPSYAIFILATTEKHKVLPTILSRCQIFDFRRIQPRVIVQQLQNIAVERGITYEEEALYLIGQQADGILRTALSMFDKISNYGASKLTYQATLEHLQLSDHTYYFELTDALLQGDRGMVLELYDKMLKAGRDRRYFIGGLGEHFRNLLICQDQATHQLLEVAVSTQQRYQAQAAQASPAFLLAALRLVNQCDIHYQSSHNKQLHVELLLIELAQLLHPHDLDATPPATQSALPAPKQKTLSQAGSGPSQRDAATEVSAGREQQSVRASQAGRAVRTTTNVATPTTTSPSSGHDQATIAAGAKLQPAAAKPTDTSMDRPTLQHTIRLPQLAQLKARIEQEDRHDTSIATPAKVMAPASLTQEALHKHWQAYAAQLKAEGRLPAYRLLLQEIALAGTTITVRFTNAAQEGILASIKEELLAYLRRGLQHDSLDIKGELVSAASPKVPYTAQEKFAYLAEKHPHLRAFQQRLNLEVVA
ncbi:MAG: DNA polymerase III subunit gamma/tau [Bacteroidota bacterium]